MFSAAQSEIKLMPKDITINLDQRSIDLREGLYSALERAVIDTLGENPSSSIVVDLGTGRGELLKRLSARRVNWLGIDPEPECVEVASRHGPCEIGGIEDFQQILGKRVPSVIVCSHVLEHVNSPYEAIRKMHQCGAQSIVLAVPNVLRTARVIRTLLGKRRGDHPEHVYAWGHAELTSLVKRAGYTPERWYVDRVTINPFSGWIGGVLTRHLRGLEAKTLSKLLPSLSSSLIVRCSRTTGQIEKGA
jgi:hypothetical protein